MGCGQSAVATLVSVYFLAVAYRAQPFKSPLMNRIKVVSEVQVCAPAAPTAWTAQAEPAWHHAQVTSILLVATVIQVPPDALAASRRVCHTSTCDG